ncbi:enoyl-CoA hydratase-related protein [Aquirhabdus parva]|uniref:Enoyl-CoA hydratase n=1 Tax=Aquirhabdus parva TaxID=2283318 RepID=A0A345P5E4_9GAMM|nr:enoyl-CoA hydratase-related protein [Aquirhabdus parva]AXI02503.1 enoyl-CoA hydratase [Aquirhabdus parva]
MSLTCITQPHPNLNATIQDGILELVLNRPERKNALFGEFYLALEQAILEADQNPAVRVVLLRGEQDFSAGNDLQDFANSPASGIDAPPFRVLRAATSLTKPLIIAVRGVAVGIGTTLLLHADLVYCDATARFQMPFLSLGLSPEGASTLLLPQRAGYLKAAEFLLLAEPFNAEAALNAKLVNQIIPDDVYAYAREKAVRITQLPLASIKLTKAMLRDTAPTTVVERINSEAIEFVQRVKTPEMKEALTAFKEKRAPNFRQFD